MKNKIKANNLGFSLIEVIVIVAIIITATGFTVGGVTFAYRARSLQAAKIIDSMISQSKINAMSNRKNHLELFYDSDDKQYTCRLIRADGTEYATQHIGNERLDIIAEGTSLKTGKLLTISFNMDTGAIKEFRLDDESKKKSTMIINLNSYTDHVITLYEDTGEHNFE